MKLTMITKWNGHVVAVQSSLESHEDRKRSCILQTQEIVHNILNYIPSVSDIFAHLEYFNIE